MIVHQISTILINILFGAFFAIILNIFDCINIRYFIINFLFSFLITLFLGFIYIKIYNKYFFEFKFYLILFIIIGYILTNKLLTIEIKERYLAFILIIKKITPLFLFILKFSINYSLIKKLKQNFSKKKFKTNSF